MPTPNFNLPLINGASPISIVNDMNALATAADSAMGTLAPVGSVNSAITTATQAQKDATEALGKAQSATEVANAATESAANAASASSAAANSAQTANNVANSALSKANSALTYTLTRITRDNATDNGVLNFNNASTIGTNSGDGLVVVEYANFYHIEARGISIPYGSGNAVLGHFVRSDKIVKGVGYVGCAGIGINSGNTEVAFERLSDESVGLVGYTSSSGGNSRCAFNCILIKKLD